MSLSLPGAAMQGGVPYWTTDLALQHQVGYGGLCFGVVLAGGWGGAGRSDPLSCAAGQRYPGPECLPISDLPGRGISGAVSRVHCDSRKRTLTGKTGVSFCP
ncbi:hypothetical protein [Desulfocapsa sulfexigens]|uniref:hypothetical protein n=1 Tax=Desulfocapsa sulfexigens TaxID=65555 RepID=UPI0012947CFD|nr:hypothetical protein [Desulfocapsa sulfexigens]